jgi:hypothetical protein
VPAIERGGHTVTLQQEPEYRPVRDQEQWHNDGRYEKRRTQLTRYKPDRIALIESVEEARSTPKVEHPDQGEPQLGLQSSQCQQGQNRG